jgi:hypothetical protein
MGQTHPAGMQPHCTAFSAGPPQGDAPPARAAAALAPPPRCRPPPRAPAATPPPFPQAPRPPASPWDPGMDEPHVPGGAGGAGAGAAAAAAAAAAPLHPLDLDRLFHEGDDRTWDMDEWNWDPSELVAAPNGVPTLNPCQVRRRAAGGAVLGRRRAARSCPARSPGARERLRTA